MNRERERKIILKAVKRFKLVRTSFKWQGEMSEYTQMRQGIRQGTTLPALNLMYKRFNNDLLNTTVGPRRRKNRNSGCVLTNMCRRYSPAYK